jgi:AraC-like DNA-binding protein
MLGDTAERLLREREGSTTVDRVRTVLRYRRDLSNLDSNTLAAAVGLTPRALRRRLGAEGASLTALLDEARLRLACEDLKRPDSSIKEISDRLGFSEPSAFHRAFQALDRAHACAVRAHWLRRATAPAGLDALEGALLGERIPLRPPRLHHVRALRVRYPLRGALHEAGRGQGLDVLSRAPHAVSSLCELQALERLGRTNTQHQQASRDQHAAQLGERARQVGPEVAHVDPEQLVEGAVGVRQTIHRALREAYLVAKAALAAEAPSRARGPHR